MESNLSGCAGAVLRDVMRLMSKRDRALWCDDLRNEAWFAEMEWEKVKDSCTKGVFVRRRLTGFLRDNDVWEDPAKKVKRPKMCSVPKELEVSDGGDFSETMQRVVNATVDGEKSYDVRTVLGLDAE